MFKVYSFALVVLVITACSDPNNQSRKVESYPVVTPLIIDTVFTQDYVADIHAIQNVEIRARIKGFIDKIHVDEGKAVQAGQLLFTISSQEFKLALLRAESQLKNAIADSKIAEVQVINTRTLVDQKIVSKSELDMAIAKLEAEQANIEVAQSAVASAQLHLSYASVRAPFNGMINRLPLKTGSLVDEGTLLTTISNYREIFAYFNLSEKQYLNILKTKTSNHENEVKLVLADGQFFPFKGKIETAESEIDKSTGNLAFRARFNNPELILRHGSSGKILLETKLTKAMIIPQKAVFEVQDNEYAYIVNDKNIIELRKLTISHRLSHFYVVETGLQPNDKIVFEGIQKLKEGDTIMPKQLSYKNVILQLSTLPK